MRPPKMCGITEPHSTHEFVVNPGSADFQMIYGCPGVGGGASGFPRVQGECPQCGSEALFLGAEGYVTCARLWCESPWAPSEALGVVFPAATS